MQTHHIYPLAFALFLVPVSCSARDASTPSDASPNNTDASRNGTAPPDARGDASESPDANQGDNETPLFSGTVYDEMDRPLPGATITVNGIRRITDASGRYHVSITAATGLFVLNASMNGRVPVSLTYSEGQPDERIILRPAWTQVINPRLDNDIRDPASGASVTLTANTLVDADGAAPVGTLTATLAYHSPRDLLDGLTAVNSQGELVALESLGAITIAVNDSRGQPFNLQYGASAAAYLPFAAEVGGQLPSCVVDDSCRLAMWYFNTDGPDAGKWREQQAMMQAGLQGVAFTMVGGIPSNEVPHSSQPIPMNEGLGTWNADLEKRTPACATIIFNKIPSVCHGETGIILQRKLPTGRNGMIKTQTGTLNKSVPIVILYNIVPNLDYALGIDFPEGTPCGCRDLKFEALPAATEPGNISNAGDPWGGTGFPRALNSDGTFGDFLKLITAGDPARNPCNSEVTYTYTGPTPPRECPDSGG